MSHCSSRALTLLSSVFGACGLLLVGIAVSTDYWLYMEEGTVLPQNQTTEVKMALHAGLWRVCFFAGLKRGVCVKINHFPEDTDYDHDSAEYLLQANCTYFKFFTTGENAHIFQRTTKKELNLAAAVIAVVGLALMALGCLCIIMVLSKGAEFLLRVGAICFGLSGLLLLVSLEVFRHSVQALLQRVSPEPPPAPALAYEYSWSLGCGMGASLVLLLASGCFLLLTLPPGPWGSLCPKLGHRAT
ncbi:voltage-dependent calcium channel gamma-6 subunit [Puma concolor]|uniref:Voltage-dependent calcium channel gamma-6 subunit n=1 Tax=Puma concolor TaxID=9696 RepID=A0A6P6H4A6_PUMCO|nr:voltage-dependent calcium channel gamma-6 subunit [Puma concolor]